LAGNLSIVFSGGFHTTVLGTNTFTVLTAGGTGINGAFSNIASGQRLLTSDGLGSFLVNYGSTSGFGQNSVVLSSYIASVPEPSTWIQLGLGAAAMCVMIRRRSRRGDR
jgi:hypothetical protein